MASTDSAYKDDVAPEGSPFRPLYDDRIMFNGQPIALVVAEEPEIARFAASLVRVEYDEERTSPICIASVTRPSHWGPGKSGRGAIRPAKAARHGRAGIRCSRGAPPGRILCPDRASQPDGAVCLDGDVGRRRQAHGLRQDPGRAERAALCLQRVRHEAGRCARHVALHGRRVRLRAAPAISGGAGRAGGARAGALGAPRADPAADVRARLPARHDPAHRSSAQKPTERSTRSRTKPSR